MGEVTAPLVLICISIVMNGIGFSTFFIYLLAIFMPALNVHSSSSPLFLDCVSSQIPPIFNISIIQNLIDVYTDHDQLLPGRLKIDYDITDYNSRIPNYT